MNNQITQRSAYLPTRPELPNPEVKIPNATIKQLKPKSVLETLKELRLTQREVQTAIRSIVPISKNVEMLARNAKGGGGGGNTGRINNMSRGGDEINPLRAKAEMDKAINTATINAERDRREFKKETERINSEYYRTLFQGISRLSTPFDLLYNFVNAGKKKRERTEDLDFKRAYQQMTKNIQNDYETKKFIAAQWAYMQMKVKDRDASVKFEEEYQKRRLAQLSQSNELMVKELNLTAAASNIVASGTNHFNISEAKILMANMTGGGFTQSQNGFTQIPQIQNQQLMLEDKTVIATDEMTNGVVVGEVQNHSEAFWQQIREENERGKNTREADFEYIDQENDFRNDQLQAQNEQRDVLQNLFGATDEQEDLLRGILNKNPEGVKEQEKVEQKQKSLWEKLLPWLLIALPGLYGIARKFISDNKEYFDKLMANIPQMIDSLKTIASWALDSLPDILSYIETMVSTIAGKKTNPVGDWFNSLAEDGAYDNNAYRVNRERRENNMSNNPFVRIGQMAQNDYDRFMELMTAPANATYSTLGAAANLLGGLIPGVNRTTPENAAEGSVYRRMRQQNSRTRNEGGPPVRLPALASGAVDRGGIEVLRGDQSGMSAEDSYDYLQPVVKEALANLQNVVALKGHRLQLNSGFRTQEANARLPGSAQNSLHTAGLAADVAVQTPEGKLTMAEYLTKYPDFLRNVEDAGMIQLADKTTYEGQQHLQMKGYLQGEQGYSQIASKIGSAQASYNVNNAPTIQAPNPLMNDFIMKAFDAVLANMGMQTEAMKENTNVNAAGHAKTANSIRVNRNPTPTKSFSMVNTQQVIASA